ncbi:MAG TPA: dihydrodipicolinate synthase family protein [Vicinamibacteria bacterium]
MNDGAGAPNGHVRLIVALLTPLTPEGRVDAESLAGHVRHLLGEGADGFFVCGTTGEGPLLDDDEVALATRTVAEACAGRARVTAQVGRPGTVATVRLLRRAREAGADDVAVVAPYYYELEESQIEAHYRAALEAAPGTRVHAYAIPRRTGNDLDPPLVRRLAAEGLGGIKDSTRSLDRHREYLSVAAEHRARGFAVFMGSDALAHAGILGGSSGIVSAMANVRPDLFVQLRAAAAAGREREAADCQAQIDALRASLQNGSMIAGLKAAVAARLAPLGVAYPGGVRAPLRELP